MNDRAAIAEALAHIPADDREVWTRMCFALKDELGDDGFEIWNDWSRTSDRYQRNAARSTWRSAKPGRGITIASLFWLARQHGWTGNQRDSKRSPNGGYEKAGEILGSRRPSTPVDPPDDSDARAQAATIMESVSLETHPYLERKGFPDLQWLVLGEHLIVPMRRGQDLVSVQRIAPDGTKRFLRGSRVAGASHYVRHTDAPVLRAYTEGLASALSVDAALRMLHVRADVVVAFSAGNMPAVIRTAPRGCRQVVIADNDASQAGQRAARATGLPWWAPGIEGWDANDIHARQGLDVLAAELKAGL